KLDKALLDTLSKYFKNRGFKYRNDLYNMNTCAKNGMNYRLVECCFIDNKNDVNKFISNRDAIAKKFVANITSF
ncbi:MAG TPA: N-acetylmuramoyl-L-alanine amidase, partial [Clostridia bacterium]|nr:N-acetylmuramoyl-L-alanine amidase [Clostridia bacterium]